MNIVKQIEKNNLSLFQEYSNEELLVILKSTIFEYLKIVESEKIAQHILREYCFPRTFMYNLTIKKRFFKLMHCANLRNLEIPNEWFQIEILNSDVIDRLDEIRNMEIEWTVKNEFGENTDKEVDAVNCFFDGIIKNEFGNKDIKNVFSYKHYGKGKLRK